MEGISKTFFGVRALERVSFSVFPGEVHALVGENGAGKSTLIKILAGIFQPDQGSIRAEGRPVVFHEPRDARALGISVIHQDLKVVPTLSVAENICLADLPTRSWGPLRLVNRRDLRRQAAHLLGRLNLNLPLDVPVGALAFAEKQLVQVAKAFSTRARLLVMDEPTASLEPRETRKLFDLIRRFKMDGGSVVFISHRIEEVLEIADRVTVLRDGRVVERAGAATLSPDRLIHLIVGRRLDQLYPKLAVTIGPELVRVDELTLEPSGPSYRFTLGEGEILAFTGLLGAGCKELLKGLCGVRRALRRQVSVGGVPARVESPREALRAGIGLIPEERLAHGLVPELSVAENILLASLRRVTVRGFLSRRRMADEAGRHIRALGIRTPNAWTPVKNLSGGNQQKVLIARFLVSNLCVLAMDEPTHGVDVGAKAEIHRLMGEYVARGHAILLVSSEFPEVLGLGDRIFVLRRGSMVAELNRRDATEELLLSRAAGVGA